MAPVSVTQASLVLVVKEKLVQMHVVAMVSARTAACVHALTDLAVKTVVINHVQVIPQLVLAVVMVYAITENVNVLVSTQDHSMTRQCGSAMIVVSKRAQAASMIALHW